MSVNRTLLGTTALAGVGLRQYKRGKARWASAASWSARLSMPAKTQGLIRATLMVLSPMAMTRTNLFA